MTNVNTDERTRDDDTIPGVKGWTYSDVGRELKERRREERLFGPGAQEIVEEPVDDGAFGGDWEHILDEDGCIDKRATRERRLFGSDRF